MPEPQRINPGGGKSTLIRTLMAQAEHQTRIHDLREGEWAFLANAFGTQQKELGVHFRTRRSPGRRFLAILTALLVVVSVQLPASALLLSDPPDNDNLADARAGFSFPFADTVRIDDATFESQEPYPCHYGSSQTIWYRLNLQEDTEVRVTVNTEDDFGPLVAVYEGSSYGALTKVACESDSYYRPPTVGFLASTDKTYMVQVAAAFGEGQGDISVEIDLAGTISGRVTDAKSGLGVAGICANAYNTDYFLSVTSQTDGAYTIHGLDTGEYEVYFYNCDQSYGYRYQVQDWDDPSTPGADKVSVIKGGSVTGIDQALNRTTWITGKVTDSSGNPLQGICVRVAGYSYTQVTTRADGTYLFGTWLSGDDKVRFGCGYGQWATQWYAGKSSQGVADTVHLTYGEETSGIDAVLQLNPVPVNDNRADATEAVLPYSQFLSNHFASVEPGENQTCGNMKNTVWYKFTAQTSGSVSVQVEDYSNWSTSSQAIAGYLDLAGSKDLVRLECNVINDFTYPSFTMSFRVIEGNTYYVQVGAYDPTVSGIQYQPRDITVSLNLIPKPLNDEFGSARAVSSLPFDDTLALSGASVEAGEPQSCGGPYDSTVWYQYTALVDEKVRVYDTAWDAEPGIGVYKQELPLGVAGLKEIACHDWLGNGVAEFKAKAGVTYYIQVGSLAARFARLFGLAIRKWELAPNDNLAEARTITSLPYADPYSTAGATLEDLEPKCGDADPSRTIWYRYISPSAEFLSVGTGRPYYGNVGVYLQEGQGTAGLVQIACDTDDVGNRKAHVGFQAEAGRTYYIQLDSESDSTEMMQVRAESAPANDNLSQAEVVAGPSAQVEGRTYMATAEGVEANQCEGMLRTVWYRYTPLSDGTLDLSSAGSDFDTVVGVYRSTGAELALGPAGLEPIACNDDVTAGRVRHSHLEVPVLAGMTYFIQATGWRGDYGELRLTFELE